MLNIRNRIKIIIAWFSLYDHSEHKCFGSIVGTKHRTSRTSTCYISLYNRFSENAFSNFGSTTVSAAQLYFTLVLQMGLPIEPFLIRFRLRHSRSGLLNFSGREWVGFLRVRPIRVGSVVGLIKSRKINFNSDWIIIKKYIRNSIIGSHKNLSGGILKVGIGT